VKRNHFRSFAILIGLLACAGACYGILHLWQQPADAYWTATAFSPPLASASDRVELFVADEPLLKVVGEERLILKKKSTEAPVAAGDLVARVNNYERVRLARIPTLLGLAAAAGGGLILFLIGLFAPLIRELVPPPIVDLHLEA
jgi:hypothetical protein